MMTVDEAADLLNASVEFVSKLLSDGKLPSLSTEDVAEYKQLQDAVSATALDELFKQAQELGLNEDELPHGPMGKEFGGPDCEYD
jgi:hypothetical protein